MYIFDGETSVNWSKISNSIESDRDEEHLSTYDE